MDDPSSLPPPDIRRRRGRRWRPQPQLPTEEIRLWMLRILSDGGGFLRIPPSERDDLLVRLELGEAIANLTMTDRSTPEELRVAVDLLASELKALEEKSPRGGWAGENARMVGDGVGLSEVETEVFALAIAASADEALGELLGNRRMARTRAELIQIIACALKLSPQEVRDAIVKQSGARSLRLFQLSYQTHHTSPLSLSDAMGDVLLEPLESAAEFLSHFVETSRASQLQAQDYAHIEQDLELVRRLIADALKQNTRGMNVLIYGAPGTGKTEFARCVLQMNGACGHEVSLEDSDGDAVCGPDRLTRYAVAQQMLREQASSVMVFDELEDAFPMQSSFFGPVRKSGALKAWTNRLLEDNPRPTIWISNEIEQIDPAFVRRFALRIEITSPPQSVRRRLAARYTDGLSVNRELLDRIARDERILPAHIEQAAMVTRAARSGDNVDDGPMLRRVLDHNQRALGQNGTLKLEHGNILRHDIELVNASVDIGQLAAGLRRSGSGRLCFYGPPGTGKTALAAHLAQHLDLALLEYRASDLLGMYVGQTEKNVAKMFARAKSNKSVLLIDEADSFLRDRKGADRSWEATLVNEMLTQIEHHEGIVVCTTNMLDQLDPAALRRFDVKVEFTWLTRVQARKLFCVATGAPVDDAAVESSLAALRTLTPGDFASVLRRLRIMGTTPTPGELIVMLAAEVDLKREGSGRSLGFLS